MADLTFDAKDLDVTVARLGVMTGVLEGTPGEGQLTFREEWFSDPLGNIEGIPKNKAQSDQLIQLLEELLGTVSGDALGSPTRDENRTWYPIRMPGGDGGEGKATGLYLVTEDVSGDGAASGNGSGAYTVVGLGTAYDYTKSAVLIRPYIYVPILEMPTQNGVFVLGGQDHPIELGVSVTNGSGPFGTDQVSFTGVKAFATVDFSGSAPDLDIVVTNLKLPGEAARDRTLNDLENISADEWISTAVYLLISQIAEAAPQGQEQKWSDMANAVASILGLIGSVPSVDWEALVSSPTDAGNLLSSWLKSIASDRETLKQWLQDWFALFNGVAPGQAEGKVTGSGTRQDPWSVSLLTVASGKIQLDLTVATEVDPTTKDLLVLPGFKLASEPVAPISGLDDVTVQVQASTELVQLLLPPNGSAPPKPDLFPSFEVGVCLNNPTAAFSGGKDHEDATQEGISIGAIVVGLAYREPSGGGNRAVYPDLALRQVQSPVGSWDTIDLTNLDEVVKDAEEALVNLVQKALEDFFDTAAGTSAGKIAQSLAALLGIIAPPQLPSGESWPVSDLLLTGGGVEAVIGDPLTALGSYYTRCLTTKDAAGRPAWALLLPYFASLFGDQDIQGIAATGDGSRQDPWRVALYTAGDGSKSLNAYVDSWIEEAGTGSTGPTIRLALTLGAGLKVGKAVPTLDLTVELLSLGLPAVDGSGSVSAHWLPGLTTALTLSGPQQGGAVQPLATPELAGISIEADAIRALLGWDRGVQLYSALDITQVKLLSGTTVVDDIGDLEFSFSPTRWNTQDLSKFTQLIADAVGVWLLTSGGRVGVSATAALGLLPDLSTVINGKDDEPFALPKGLALPSNWPTLNVTDSPNGGFLSDPWPAVRMQLGAVLGDGTFAEPMMRLLGWSITGTLPDAPSPVPAGTRADPWWVELEDVWQLRPLLWTGAPGAGAAGGSVGAGLARSMVQAEAGDVVLDVRLSLDAGEFCIDDGVRAGAEPIPSLALEAHLTGKGGPLVQETSGLRIGTATLGASVSRGGIAPVLVLNQARLDSSEQLRTIDLATALASSQGRQALESLVFPLTVKLTLAALELPALKATLEALTELGLGILKDGTGARVDALAEGVSFEVELGGWRSMLADPSAFLATQAGSSLSDPETSAKLFGYLAKILGYDSFELPASLQGLPYVLVALDLLEDYGGGLGPKLSSWLSFLENPVSYLEARAKVLLDPTDSTARHALVTALTKSGVPTKPGPDVPLYISNGSLVTLQIPASKRPHIGSELELAAQLTLNLQALSLDGGVTVTSPSFGLGLALDVALDFGGGTGTWMGAPAGPTWSLALVNGDPTLRELVEPLVFYPLPDAASVQAYLEELGKRVPIFIASALGARLLNSYVIPEYPVAQRLLTDLGLAAPSADGGAPQVQSLVPVFTHPIDWVLSEQALGDGSGTLDLTKVGQFLSDLPDPSGTKGPGSILLKPTAGGMSLTGLPFGVSCAFTADATNGVHIVPEIKPALPSPAPAVDIAADLGFGLGAGVSVGGSASLGFALPDQGDDPTKLAVKATYEKGSFTLGVDGTFKGTRFPSTGEIALIPFGGLNQFVDSGAAKALLKYAAGQLVVLFQDYEKKPDHSQAVVERVQGIVSVLAYFDVTDVDSFFATTQAVATAPLDWLMSWFEDAKLDATLAKLDDLFTTQLGLTGFSVKGSALVYEPSLPVASAALQVQFGKQESAGPFGVWLSPSMRLDFIEIGAGAGLAFKSLAAQPELEFDLASWVGIAPESIPIPQMKEGPQVRFALAATLQGLENADLRAYPLGYGTTAETMLVDLLPHPQFAYGDKPDTAVPAATWVPEFLLHYLVPLVADAVLRTPPVQDWLNAPLVAGKPLTAPGGLMVDWGLFQGSAGEYPTGLSSRARLTFAGNGSPPAPASPGTGVELLPPEAVLGDSTTYTLSDLRQLWQGMSAAEVVEKLFFVILKAFDGIKIVPIKDGGIFIASATKGDATDYGLRLQIPDILISGGTPGSKKLVLQLGKWLSHQPDGKSWIHQSDPSIDPEPGVSFYFLRGKGDDLPTFHGRMDLVSVGVDFSGADEKTPLVDIKGFQIGGFEPRVYFSIDQTDPGGFVLGGAIQMDRLGIPVGPSIGSGSGNDNPVAENILASGKDPAKPDQTLNPTFSVALGKVGGKGTTFVVDLFADQGTTKDPNGVLWIPIQRAFGPLDIQKIGIGFGEDGSVYLLTIGFDGSVTLVGLSLSLVNLTVGIPVAEPLNFEDYRLGLDGLDVTYANGPIEISGGFLKSTTTPVDYTGMALIEAATFGLSAMGSYSQLDKSTPSLFVFALLSTPIGGPPYFFLTGVAAGFGYNRKLILPDQDSVAAYPLVGGVLDPAKYFPAGNDPGGALTAIQDKIPPSRGDYWLAAGIKFTSFELLDSFALLTVSFGTEFELALLGLSVIELPKGVSGDVPIVRAELQLMVTFKPSIGLLAATATLTQNSYVLDKDCHLTGGFAFYVWFSGDHAGDFVVTLGGYHPDFKKPSYYPDEPRLGFNWPVGGGVSIKGGAYLALTSSAVMAGGSLEVLFQSGKLKAWLTAVANFLIQWKPFWYDIEIGVSVGASYRVDALFIHKTFTVELGADLTINGPPLHGRARVHWWIISFTIEFGPSNHKPGSLDWTDFDDSFLPKGQSKVSVTHRLMPDGVTLTAPATVQEEMSRDARCGARVVKGLVKSEIVKETGEVTRWVINPQSFCLETNASVPSTELTVNGVKVTPTMPVDTKLGIVPMGKTTLTSVQDLTITKHETGNQWVPVAAGTFAADYVTKAASQALWAKSPPDGLNGSDTTIPDVPVGLNVTAPEKPYDSVVPIPWANLEFEQDQPRYFQWGSVLPPTKPQYDQTGALEKEMDTIMESTVVEKRAGIMRALLQNRVAVNTDVSLHLLSKTAAEVFLDPPQLVTLGGFVEVL